MMSYQYVSYWILLLSIYYAIKSAQTDTQKCHIIRY